MTRLDWEKAARRDRLERRYSSARLPKPTPKQIAFLKDLSKRTGMKLPKPTTIREAGEQIDALLDLESKTRARALAAESGSERGKPARAPRRPDVARAK